MSKKTPFSTPPVKPVPPPATPVTPIAPDPKRWDRAKLDAKLDFDGPEGFWKAKYTYALIGVAVVIGLLVAFA